MTSKNTTLNISDDSIRILLGWFLTIWAIFSQDIIRADTELSGFISAEYRYFYHDSSQTEKNNHHYDLGIVLAPQLFFDWDNGQQNLIFSPFLRVDNRDAERSHADIRELVWQGYRGDWAWRVGIAKVFWGVTESQHLVDVINQTDLVENIDTEDKLGQPMVNINLYREWGALEFFILPYFRERTFPGENGRLRGDIIIDESSTTYESGAKRQNIDLALRWTHSIGFWDVAISHFYGTNRQPELILDEATNLFSAYYHIMHQTGIEIQYTYDAWLWKWESIRRETEDETFSAFAGGFEYTFYTVADSVIDIGILTEYMFDDRDDNSLTSFEDDILLGVRIVGNDAAASDLLIGITYDLTTSDTGLRVEASTRLNDRWKLSLESNILNTQDTDSIIYNSRKDDFVQLTISRFF